MRHPGLIAGITSWEHIETQEWPLREKGLGSPFLRRAKWPFTREQSMMLLLPVSRRRPMINKSKLAAILAASAFIAAAGLASPTFAAGPYGQGYTGGGSAGYNHHVSTDYKLKHHQTKRHQPSQAK